MFFQKSLMNPILGPSYWGYAKSDASSTWISRQNGRCGAARVETGGESGNPQTEPLQIASMQTASWWHGIWPWWTGAGRKRRWRLKKTWSCQSTYPILNFVVYNWRLLCNLATPSQMCMSPRAKWIWCSRCEMVFLQSFWGCFQKSWVIWFRHHIPMEDCRG